MSLSLLEFCRRNKVKLSGVAKIAGVDKGTIYKVARGERGVSLETADKIARATGGAVTPNDLTKTRMEWLAANPEAEKKSLGDAPREPAEVA